MRVWKMALGLATVAGCVKSAPPPPAPIVIREPPTVINRTIIRIPQSLPEGVTPGSRAGRAVKDFRAAEKAARDVRSYPNASQEDIRAVNDAETGAFHATQRLITKDGHSTQEDQDHAHEAIDRLRKAQQKIMENEPKQRGTTE